MFSIDGYELPTQLHVGRRTQIFRGVRVSDGAPVIVKTLRRELATPRDVARLRHEHSVLQRVDDPRVVRALELLVQGPRSALVLYDIGGVALSELETSFLELELDERLHYACELTRALMAVHSAGVIHKDVKPANVIVQRARRRLVLSDFSISSALDAERGALASADVLEGTLAYLSPEQTGRMNRLVDYRADFYSLGVTLYELLTGQLPFHAPDAMGLVHAHVARVPVSPQALLPSIPAPLSEITMRLLAKNAEDRYQSASGILADLERVRDALRTRDEVESFTLAADDTYERFRLPAKLYGRAASREAILAAFERASAGGNELLLIGGPSGIGKSALIRELHREMVKLRGHFVTGKFDLQERDRPYAAVAQALRALARALLLEPEDRLRAWASALRTALGPNGQVALDLAPELERVIGPQPPLRPLPPSETANRFRVTTHALFKALAGERHPLVLFLDDLQWSDLATLQLIEQLAADPELTHVLWIGAYRDSEVPADHNLERAVAALLEAGAAVERLTLGPLDEEPIALLLVDALHHAPDVVRPLAALLREKTEGNPFFVRAYLESLHERGELRFDQRRGSWTWSLDQVAQAELPDDAAALVAARIAKLPSAAQELLRDAACVGARFELQVVARLLELTGADALARLWPAVTRGLVRPLDEHYKFIADDAQPTHFEFVHDRVQQAAYEQLPAAERPRLHLAIARELQAREDEGARDQRLFTLAGHYQVAAAAGLVVEPGERARVASLELDAARRAKLSTAYRSACGYLEVGLGLLPARPWDDAYAPCFALHRERVESEFLAGNPERALEFFTPLLARSRTAIERADLFALRATLETERGALPAAIEAGREGLAQLGARLPRNTTTLHVLKEYARFRLLRGSASAEELLARPELEDPARRAELRVLVSMTAAAYFVDTSLASLVLLRIASISVGHGLSELSAYGFIGVGLVQSGAFGQYAAADELGQLARDMNERFDNAQLRTRITLFWATFMMVWARPFAEVKPVLRDAVRLGVESGDLIYAVYSAMTEVFMMVMAGDSLDDVHTQCASAKQFVARRELEDQLATATYIQRVFGERLRGVESEFDEAEYAAGLSDERTPLTMFYYNLYRAMHAYITGDQETAYASLQQALLRTKVAFGSCFIADLRFYECLILARQLPEARGLSRRKLIKTIRQGLAQLRRWARSAPANYGAREALARAEWLRASGREADALGFYNLAIASAREHGAPNVEALACECALRFARARPQDHGVLASAYLEDALRAYRVWGASAKVVALAREFNVSAAGAPDPIANATLTMTRSTTAFALDLHTVVKVSQAISGELEMDGLLRRLTALLVENAGARRGVLVLAEDDALLVEAESSADEGGARVGLATPLADYEALPRRLIQYVARLREDVVLHDASRDPVHGDDPYIAARAPQSVLCTPVLHQGQLACVVYLENDLTAGVFTRRRLALIKQLAAQIAISLTNARLYQRLDEARRAALAADQAKTRFLMNMSHEFRTPLNAILGYSELLADRIAEGDLTSAEEDLHAIHAAGVRLLRSVSSVLELTRLETETHETRLEPVELEPLVREVLTQCEPLAKARGNTLSLSLRDAPRLYTDARMLHYCVTTLLDNACRFTEDGAVRLEVDARELDARLWVELSIIDTGIGIAPEALPRIFERFAQVDESTTRAFEGTGVSLAVAQRFSALLGGEIVVVSAPGRGSTFTLRLPATHPDAKGRDAAR